MRPQFGQLPLLNDPVVTADEYRFEQMWAGIGKFELSEDVAAAGFYAGQSAPVTALQLVAVDTCDAVAIRFLL